MGIVFSILLPLIDMISDGYLFYNTLNFEGDSLAMAACRNCYNNGVAEGYENSPAERECDVCATDSNIAGKLGCASNPAVLDKMTELLRGKSCLPYGRMWCIVDEKFEQNATRRKILVVSKHQENGRKA